MTMMTMMILLFAVALVVITSVEAFSASSSASYALFDRFRPSCPANIDCIRAFDESLVAENDHNNVWVAVYRSSNNKPSVFVNDELLNAMRIATSGGDDSTTTTASVESTVTSSSDSLKIETNQNSKMETPVAVARLRPSKDIKDAFIMDSMRCLLKKENTNASCDGGSEHAEALGVGIDALLLHHLSTHDRFEGCIRTKATLVSGTLLEHRGFIPVQKLQKDMATHTSSLDKSLEEYSKRTNVEGAKNPGARDRALQILNLLGKLDRDKEMELLKQQQQQDDDDDVENDDPWAGIKQFV